MSRDAKNSLFSAAFVCVFFAALYLAAQLDDKWTQVALSLLPAFLFALAKRYVLAVNEDGDNG